LRLHELNFEVVNYNVVHDKDKQLRTFLKMPVSNKIFFMNCQQHGQKG